MAITHTIEIGKKKKSKSYSKAKTAEELKAKREKKKAEIAEDKLKFVNSIIEAAKKDKKMPWEMPNFIRFPKRLDVLDKIEKHNEKHPEDQIPRSKANYRGSNVIRLCLAMGERGYTDSRFGGYNQIAEMGGQVRKGERGVRIWAYNPEGKIKKEPNETTGEMEVVYKRNPKTGEYLLNEKGKRIPCKEPTMTPVTVFNVQQADWKKELAPEPPIRVLSPKEECPEMEKIIANSEAPVKLDQGDGFDRYYSPTLDEVHLPPKDQFKSMTQFYATAAHEIGHSTGHPKRLNRDMSGSFGTEKYAREEMVAEFSAVFLSQELEIKIPPKEMDNHVAYLKSWNEKIKVLQDKPEELTKIISDAQKATDYIKEHMLERIRDKDKKVEVKKEVKKEKPKVKGLTRKASSKSLGR